MLLVARLEAMAHGLAGAGIPTQDGIVVAGGAECSP